MDIQPIQTKIQHLRGQKIMLDFDLAELYEVETRALKQAVRRNMERFPEDFMFELTATEIGELVSKRVIASKSQLGGAVPFAFTEQGVAMLSSVLRGERAIQVNIAVMRAFVALRQYALQYAELAQKLAELESKLGEEVAGIHEAIRWLAAENEVQSNSLKALQSESEAPSEDWKNRNRIGFKR
jgi:hypothetical protein